MFNYFQVWVCEYVSKVQLRMIVTCMQILHHIVSACEVFLVFFNIVYTQDVMNLIKNKVKESHVIQVIFLYGINNLYTYT